MLHGQDPSSINLMTRCHMRFTSAAQPVGTLSGKCSHAQWQTFGLLRAMITVYEGCAPPPTHTSPGMQTGHAVWYHTESGWRPSDDVALSCKDSKLGNSYLVCWGHTHCVRRPCACRDHSDWVGQAPQQERQPCADSCRTCDNGVGLQVCCTGKQALHSIAASTTSMAC